MHRICAQSCSPQKRSRIALDPDSAIALDMRPGSFPSAIPLLRECILKYRSFA